MLPLVALATDCWLVPYAPNTLDSVSVKARIELEAQRAQTGRGTRRPQARLLRHRMAWIAQLKPAEFYQARAAALAAQDEPILVPFWLAARAVDQEAVLTSGLTIAWTRGWASYAVNPVSLAAYDFFAPLLWGRLRQPPRLEGRNSDYVRAEFAFEEMGPAAAAVIAPDEEDATLATPDGYAAPVFPFSPEGSTAPLIGLGAIEAERRAIGPGREPAHIVYPQAPEEALQPAYKLRSSAEAMSLLGWWFRRGGGADCCWVASTQKIGDLTSDLAAGVAAITTAAALAVEAGATLALLTTGQDPELVRVASRAGATVTLSAATAAAHARTWTILAPAILARHTDDELALEFRRAGDDWIADVVLAFREVPAEYAATDGEVRGETLGRLPLQAWLFQIDLDYAGATESWFLTHFESGCTTPDDQAWQYNPIEIDSITQSIDLEEDASTLTARWFPGCPWENWKTQKLAATGKLTVLRAPVDAAGVVGDPVVVWSGKLSTPEREGAIVTQKVIGANALFASKAPHIVMRPVCWKRLYGAACGLSIDDWKFGAVITAIGAHTITVDTFTRLNEAALPDGFAFADWFALGWVQWLSGGKPLRAEIISSTALAGGAITFTVGRTLGWQVGDSVVAVPGCDKTAATCWNYDPARTFDPLGSLGKFDNHDQFGGARQMPAVSPNVIIPNTRKTPAKK